VPNKSFKGGKGNIRKNSPTWIGAPGTTNSKVAVLRNKGGSNMSVAENKEIIRKKHIEEIFHKGNLTVVDEIISPEYVYHGPLGEYKGPDGFKKMVTEFRAAFPDVHYDIEEMIGEGDKLVVYYTMTATHKGTFMGIPPTGKKVTLPCVYIYTFKNGKQVQALPFLDTLMLFQQLGVKPPG
jgi:steroid delta-isomerase-like uncharacterized protein